MPDTLRDRVLTLCREHPCTTLATVDGDAPRSRLMMLFVDDDLVLTGATFAGSRKVAEITANAKVHLCIGLDMEKTGGCYACAEGAAEIRTDDASRKAVWRDAFGAYFSGPDDEKMAVLRIAPTRVEYWTMDAPHAPEVLEL